MDLAGMKHSIVAILHRYNITENAKLEEWDWTCHNSNDQQGLDTLVVSILGKKRQFKTRKLVLKQKQLNKERCVTSSTG